MSHTAHAILTATTFREDGTEAPTHEVFRNFKEFLDGLEFEVEVDTPDLAITYQVRVVEFTPEGELPARLNRVGRFRAQVAHIREHPAEWAALQGNADVEAYMSDYGDRWDLYQRVCDDMGIPWKPEICHPNPED